MAAELRWGCSEVWDGCFFGTLYRLSHNGCIANLDSYRQPLSEESPGSFVIGFRDNLAAKLFQEVVAVGSESAEVFDCNRLENVVSGQALVLHSRCFCFVYFCRTWEGSSGTLDMTRRLTHVKSQIRQSPFFHGERVISSSLLPSSRERPTGSRDD